MGTATHTGNGPLGSCEVSESLRGFIDRVVVPAVLEQSLREMTQADALTERVHQALSTDVLATEVQP